LDHDGIGTHAQQGADSESQSRRVHAKASWVPLQIMRGRDVAARLPAECRTIGPNKLLATSSVPLVERTRNAAVQTKTTLPERSAFSSCTLAILAATLGKINEKVSGDNTGARIIRPDRPASLAVVFVLEVAAG
jgi:hypothetical protein